MKDEKKNVIKVQMIDPPSGWKYGFPKPIPEDVTDINKWLTENGYPQEEILSFGDYFFCRFWIQECETEPSILDDMSKSDWLNLKTCIENNFSKETINGIVVSDFSYMSPKYMELLIYFNKNWKKFLPIVSGNMTYNEMIYKICCIKISEK
jgi:hypothetical protein